MPAGWQDPVTQGGGGMQFVMPTVTPVVKALIVANVAAFAVTYLLELVSPSAWASFELFLGLSPEAWKDWFPVLPVWQLLTYGFLHGSFQHILFNMLGLYFLGSQLEGIVGGRRFLVTYIGGLLVGGAAMLVTGLATGDPRPTIGASGAVLAVVVATAVLRPLARVIFLIFPLTLRTLALIFVALDVFGALESLRGGGGGVAHGAHLAGAAFGFYMARTGRIWRDPIASWQRKAERREHEREVHDAERLDEVLEKIHREGIQALTPREKALLKRMSKGR